jgi:hypothetical protein
MTFSYEFQQRCNRRKNMRQKAQEIVLSLLEPFALEKLYPPIDNEVKPGVWKPTYEIQPHQKKVHMGIAPSGNRCKALLFNGGVGSGKTRCLCAEMVKLLRTYPGIKIVCVTGYDYYFDEFLMPTWWLVLPEDSPHIKSYNKKSRMLTMVNGSTIRFKAYDDPDKVKGWEAHVIWIEEASELGDGNNDKAFAIWLALLMRLRASRPHYALRVYVSQNPKGHNWVWKVFIKNQPGEADQPLGDWGKKTVFGFDKDGNEKFYKEWEKRHINGDIFYTISTGSSANAHLPPGYIASMLGGMADTPGIRERMVAGDFNPINTLVYDFPVYSEKTHVISYQNFLEYWEIPEIPDWWRVVVGIDCGGQRSPWAVEYYAQTEDGHWVAFDEIYLAGLTWGEIADRILEKSERFERVEYWIDPISSNQKAGPTSDTIKEEFQRRGINVKMPKHYNKSGGIMRVQSFLHRDHSQACPYLNDVQMQNDNGELYWEIGHSQLYYLTGVPFAYNDKNNKGHGCPGNIAEKSVYRYDSTKQRATKESEEGLSPYVSEKLIDRDDHAQTAEMFAFLGIKPLEMHGKAGRKRVEMPEPDVRYGRRAKQRRIT